MRITKHAMDRIKERNISKEAIIKTLKEGKKCVNRHDSNKWTFINREDNVYCVVSKDMSALITVFRKEY